MKPLIDWERVSSALADALDREGQARSEYLAQLHHSDPALAAEVESLIAAGDPHNPITRILDNALAEPAAPQQLGPYRLLERIAIGGMGEVYRAERADGQFERVVAIKILPLWATHNPGFNFAFERERRLLAQLNHPHIAQLLDSGYAPDTGQPYVVMEFLSGGNIQQADPPSRLKALAKIARATHFAHQRSILHCDIKPANILLDERGEPRLTDFGIAAAAGLPDQPAGMRWQSAGFTSPETIAGQPPTTVADVYSLGRVLASIAPEPNADLAAVIARATHSDPHQRYSSAADLATDLDRYLVGQPVTARPLSLPARLLRWAIRYPAAAAVLVLTFALFLSAALLAGANLRLSYSLDELTRLTFRFDPEDTTGMPASPALRRLYADRMAAALDQLSTQVRWRPSLRPDLVQRYHQLSWLFLNKGPSSLNEAALAETTLRKALSLAAGDPSLEAPLQTTYGVLLVNERRRDESLPHFEAAINYWRSQDSSQLKPAGHAELARAHMEYARALPGRSPEAAAELQAARGSILRALEIAPHNPEWHRRAAHVHLRSIFSYPLNSPQTGQLLNFALKHALWVTDKLPNDPRAADLLANIHLHSGRHHTALTDFAAAANHFKQANDLLTLWQQRESDNPKFSENAALVLSYWGHLDLDQGHFADARSHFGDARQRLENMPPPAVSSDALDLERAHLEIILGESLCAFRLGETKVACDLVTRWSPALKIHNEAEANKRSIGFHPDILAACPAPALF